MVVVGCAVQQARHSASSSSSLCSHVARSHHDRCSQLKASTTLLSLSSGTRLLVLAIFSFLTRIRGHDHSARLLYLRQHLESLVSSVSTPLRMCSESAVDIRGSSNLINETMSVFAANFDSGAKWLSFAVGGAILIMFALHLLRNCWIRLINAYVLSRSWTPMNISRY